MSVERNLPENKQRRRDSQVFHWEQTVRKIGSARDMLKLSMTEVYASPQAIPEHVRADYERLLDCMEWQFHWSNQMAAAAIAIADPLSPEDT
jgi:hypothetical protein